ncbi:MAG: hypothetical protein WC667_09075 [Sulfurimonas sp.]
MKTLFLAVFLAVFLNAEIVPGAEVTASLTESPTLNTTITSVQDTISKKLIEQKKVTDGAIAGTVKTVNYFQSENKTNCKNIEDLACPPLKAEYAGSYGSVTDYINPLTGEVKCSVFRRGDFQDGFKEGSDAASVNTKTFQNKTCVQEFGASNNKDMSDPTKLMKEEAKQRAHELQNLQLKYEIDYKTNGSDKFLDLGDWLDVLVTMDAEKINFAQTLEQGEIHLNSGYTVIPNDNLVDGFTNSVKSLMAANNEALTTQQIESAVYNSKIQNDQSKQLANAGFVMYLDFFVHSNKLINEIINTLLAGFVLWNLLTNWLFKSLTAKMSGYSEGQNHVGRAVFGVLIFIVFYTGSSDMIRLQNNGGTSEVEYKSQRIQDTLRALYSFTNDMSDNIAKIAIDSYLRSLTKSSGVANIEVIDSLSSEKIALQREINYLENISNQCESTYNTAAVETSTAAFRNTMLKNSIQDIKGENKKTEVKTEQLFGWSGFDAFGYKDILKFDGIKNNYEVTEVMKEAVSQIKINPYPVSEREANEMMRLSKQTPYSSGGGLLKAGVDTNKPFITLSACSFNRQKLITNHARQNEIDAKFKMMNDPLNYNLKVDKLKAVSDIMYRNYADLGYISMIYLPVTAYMLNKNGDLKDNSKSELEDKETILQTISKQITYLALFNGNSIADALNSVMGSTLVTKPFALAGAAVVINSMIEVASVLAYVVAGIFAIIYLTITKLYVFFAVLFLVIWAFGTNQEEKIYGALGRVIATSFKTVLIVISLFIAIFAMDLINSLEHILLFQFFDNMEIINEVGDHRSQSLWTNIVNWVSESGEQLNVNLQKYVVFGLTQAVFTVVKITLTVTIIWKLPSLFFEFISVQVDGAEQKLGEIVQDIGEKQSMKGI